MTSATLTPAPPTTVVEQARAQVAGLCEEMWAAKSAGTLLDTYKSLEMLKSVVEAVELQVVHEIDATGAAASQDWSSTKDFVTAVSGGKKGAGASTLKLARAVCGDCQQTGAALAEGAISRLQAQVVVNTVDSLPVNPGLRRAAEELMLTEARTRDASDLLQVSKHLIERLDPDGDERRTERQLARDERSAHLNRFLTISPDGAGGVRLKGRTTVEDAALIKAALWSLSAPRPAAPDSCGGHGTCEVDSCAHDGRDPRDHGARFLDALVEGCQQLLDAEVLPEAHGRKPRLNLTMSLADLKAGVGSATLETGQTLSASAVRRLCCDSAVIPTVLGTHSEVLDVGRTQRLVTVALWKALVVRDRHCAFPGCTRPPIACDAHHIQHWVDGGETSLPNLVMLCRAHHTLIHNTPWTVRLNPVDHRPEFIPPARLDPQQRPTRQRQPRE